MNRWWVYLILLPDLNGELSWICNNYACGGAILRPWAKLVVFSKLLIQRWHSGLMFYHRCLFACLYSWFILTVQYNMWCAVAGETIDRDVDRQMAGSSTDPQGILSAQPLSQWLSRLHSHNLTKHPDLISATFIRRSYTFLRLLLRAVSFSFV